jgi:hypothetical protein
VADLEGLVALLNRLLKNSFSSASGAKALTEKIGLDRSA